MQKCLENVIHLRISSVQYDALHFYDRNFCSLMRSPAGQFTAFLNIKKLQECIRFLRRRSGVRNPDIHFGILRNAYLRADFCRAGVFRKSVKRSHSDGAKSIFELFKSDVNSRRTVFALCFLRYRIVHVLNKAFPYEINPYKLFR